jgi:tetratricopeptide (TPR) repeat protein
MNNAAPQAEEGATTQPADVAGDEFLLLEDLVPVKRDAAMRSLKRTLAEMGELTRENRWQDAVELFYPPEEKVPELCDLGLDVPVRAKLAFALGQLKRFDDAIAELQQCLAREPDNFQHHNSLAYTAYNSLWAAKNREVLLSGKARADRVALAHSHFAAALALRPDSVTNFYRRGMLVKEIEGKPAKSLPFFRQAVETWEKFSEAQRSERHRERRNYVKALYRLAAVLLDAGRALHALGVLKRCLAEDEQSNYLSLEFKYFALGKISFQLNHFEEARDALLFAARSGQRGAADFVYELLARTYLAMDRLEKAREAIARIPEKRRRPYVRWTEADVLCRAGEYDAARRVLLDSSRRDRRSRHKSLLRLTRIAYLLGNFPEAQRFAEEADDFFREKWTHPLAEALFWRAVCALRLGDPQKSRSLAGELEDFDPGYAGLDKLRARLAPRSSSGRENAEVLHGRR